MTNRPFLMPNVELTGEQLADLWMQGEWRAAGGKEAYDRRQELLREARAAMPPVPELREVLARFWAAYGGESWDGMTAIEREARIGEMDRVIRATANPHYHD